MLTPSNDPNSSNDKNSRRSQHGFRAPWVLILPLALAAGVLVQQSQSPTDTSRLATQNVTGIPTQNNAASEEVPGEAVTYALYAPDDNGDLKRETATDNEWRVSADDIAQRADEVRAQAATRAVEMLMQRHPDDFPQGAQLLDDAKVEGDVTSLNFNKEFTDSSFWQGSTRTLSSVYAIVNTAVESQKTIIGSENDGEIQLLVENKPVSALGELDTQKPLKPDWNMVAKAGTN
jgi:spore germination protein GerM